MKRAIYISVFSLFFTVHTFSQKLQIFGGQKHDVYLGCLNCSNLETMSIWNIKGNYGNSQYSKSIWNDKGIYGSSTSTYSPWNINANYPPELKDNNGEFYGYLSINEVNGYRADFKLVKTLYEDHDLIKQDVESWYHKIFSRSILGSN